LGFLVVRRDAYGGIIYCILQLLFVVVPTLSLLLPNLRLIIIYKRKEKKSQLRQKKIKKNSNATFST
jgi:hypothetical protein